MKRTPLRLFLAILLPVASAFADAPKPLPGIKHVVVIGFDGFGSYAWPKAEMPRLKAFAATGSSTLVCKVVAPSSSAPNWASHFMGAGPESHHYTAWNSAKPTAPIEFKNKFGYFPGIFGEMRVQRPDSKLVVVHNWDGIAPLVDKPALDVIKQTETMQQTESVFISYLKKEKPTLGFVHFNEPDSTGHGPGHNTPEYYAMLRECDKRVGRILDAIKAAGMDKDTIVMVIADHGGINKGHGGKTPQECQVAWIISGPGVKPDHRIAGDVSNTDTAPTIARIFGLKAPQAWTGKAVEDVFVTR